MRVRGESPVSRAEAFLELSRLECKPLERSRLFRARRRIIALEALQFSNKWSLVLRIHIRIIASADKGSHEHKQLFNSLIYIYLEWSPEERVSYPQLNCIQKCDES